MLTKTKIYKNEAPLDMNKEAQHKNKYIHVYGWGWVDHTNVSIVIMYS